MEKNVNEPSTLRRTGARARAAPGLTRSGQGFQASRTARLPRQRPARCGAGARLERGRGVKGGEGGDKGGGGIAAGQADGGQATPGGACAGPPRRV